MFFSRMKATLCVVSCAFMSSLLIIAQQVPQPVINIVVNRVQNNSGKKLAIKIGDQRKFLKQGRNEKLKLSIPLVQKPDELPQYYYLIPQSPVEIWSVDTSNSMSERIATLYFDATESDDGRNQMMGLIFLEGRNYPIAGFDYTLSAHQVSGHNSITYPIHITFENGLKATDKGTVIQLLGKSSADVPTAILK